MRSFRTLVSMSVVLLAMTTGLATAQQVYPIIELEVEDVYTSRPWAMRTVQFSPDQTSCALIRFNNETDTRITVIGNASSLRIVLVDYGGEGIPDISGGALLAVDDQDPIPVNSIYSNKFAAVFDIGDEFIDQLKRGNKFTMIGADREETDPVPLKGSSKALKSFEDCMQANTSALSTISADYPYELAAIEAIKGGFYWLKFAQRHIRGQQDVASASEKAVLLRTMLRSRLDRLDSKGGFSQKKLENGEAVDETLTVAWYLLTGYGGPVDVEAALEVMSKDYIQDSKDAQFYLGYAHETGVNGQPNIEEADYYYTKAAEAPLSPFIMNRIVSFYARSYKERNPDYKKARAILEKGVATLENPRPAKRALARYLIEGRGGEPDVQRAIEYYQIEEDADIPKLGTYLSVLRNAKEPIIDEFNDVLDRMRDQNPAADRVKIRFLWDGSDAYPQDRAQAVEIAMAIRDSENEELNMTHDLGPECLALAIHESGNALKEALPLSHAEALKALSDKIRIQLSSEDLTPERSASLRHTLAQATAGYALATGDFGPSAEIHALTEYPLHYRAVYGAVFERELLGYLALREGKEPDGLWADDVYFEYLTKRLLSEYEVARPVWNCLPSRDLHDPRKIADLKLFQTSEKCGDLISEANHCGMISDDTELLTLRDRALANLTTRASSGSAARAVETVFLSSMWSGSPSGACSFSSGPARVEAANAIRVCVGLNGK